MRKLIASPIALAGLFSSAITSLLVLLGPTKAVAAVIGLPMAIAVFEWPIIGLVALILTGTCFQTLGTESMTGLPLSLGKLVGLLTMITWLLKSTRDRTPWTYSPQMLALLAYVGAMAIVGLLVHPAEPAADNGFMRFLQVAVVFWLVANLAGTDQRALLVGCASLTAGMAVCGVIGALEYLVPSLELPYDETAPQTGGIGAAVDRDSLYGFDLRRITGGLGDSNWLALFIVTVLPLNLFWWWRARGFMARSLVLMVSGIQLLALIMSYTRAGFVGLSVALLYLVGRRVISVRLLAWAGIAAFLVSLIWLPTGFVERFFSAKYLQEGSTPARIALTGTAWRLALERPLLGHGYGQFGIKFIDQADTDLSTPVGAFGAEQIRAVKEGREFASNIGTHNLYLEIIVEYGLLGLAPFVTFIILAFQDLRCANRWGNEEQRLLATCIAAGLIAFCVCGLFVHARYVKMLWLITGLAAAQRRVVLTEGNWQVTNPSVKYIPR